jgi:hypothetical protein
MIEAFWLLHLNLELYSIHQEEEFNTGVNSDPQFEIFSITFCMLTHGLVSYGTRFRVFVLFLLQSVDGSMWNQYRTV